MNVNAIANHKYAASVENTGSIENEKSFSSYLGESASLDQIFQKAAQAYQVPVELLKAVGKTESNFNPEAVSRCGATGIMQLMPSTAASLGVLNPYDAEQNIMGGAKYLSSLLSKYNGDIKLTLAAYNAGSGNVTKYNGIPPFPETQNYVVKVINYMQQDVAVPNTTYATKDTPEVSTVTKDLRKACKELDTSFSYDDYLNFIHLFLNNNSDNQNEKEQEQTSSINSKQDYSLGQINVTPAVMNLLKSIS